MLIDFNNETLKMFLPREDAPNLYNIIDIIQNKQKKISGDYTLTDDAKKYYQAEVISKELENLKKAIIDTELELNAKINDLEGQRKINQLRAKTLTSDQKLLLPIVKENYEKDNKIPDNDDFKRLLVLLADTGLVSKDTLVQIDLETPKELIKNIEQAQNQKNMLVKYTENIVGKVTAVNNDFHIKSLKANKYKSEY